MKTSCCIVGCGPAGAVLGLILARHGVPVTVLEKHGDFFRDFRGDTVHPPTLQVLGELGLLDRFMALPLQKVHTMKVFTDDGVLPFIDLRDSPGRFPYIVYVPQWDFLNLIIEEAASNPSFTLLMDTTATEVIEEDGRIRGVRYESPSGSGEIRAEVTVAADGRDSRIRAGAGLVPKNYGAPIDLLWFRLERQDSDPEDTFLRLSPGHVFPMINRGDYWQAAYIIPKGAFEELRAGDIGVFRATIRRALPFLGERANALSSWDEVRCLQVQVNRLRRWYRPGLLCIGDSAHASSPVAGFGANLAVQDAVAAGNILAGPLRQGRVGTRPLARIQRRRTLPTRVTQVIQSVIQQRAIVAGPADGTATPALPEEVDLSRFAELAVPLPLKVFGRFANRMMSSGLRTEHIAGAAARAG